METLIFQQLCLTGHLLQWQSRLRELLSYYNHFTIISISGRCCVAIATSGLIPDVETQSILTNSHSTELESLCLCSASVTAAVIPLAV